MQLDVICWFLLTLFNGVFADKRPVEQGSLVLLFENVTVDKASNEVRLYVNGAVDYWRIVTFKYVDGEISMKWDAQMADDYSKIFMDAKRNIWIANIDETYERKFSIDPSDTGIQVELTISKTSCSQIGDALSGLCIASIVIAALVVIVFLILMVKKPRIACIMCKKCNRNKKSQESVNRDKEYYDLHQPTSSQPA